MKRLVTGGLVVAAAFAFTLLMVAGVTGAGKAGLPSIVGSFCGYLIWPGMKLTEAWEGWLRRPMLGDNLFFPLLLTFNTFIYSVLFGLLLWLFRTITKPLP